MRLLHVSDLHLGRNLGELPREAEQRAVVAEIVDAAREHGVALTLISGDVFDAFNPPAWAEDVFFELLDGLADGGRRAVAVIAGNHDSGLRLAAADPLARRLGIILAGDPGEAIRGHAGPGVRVVPLAAQVARVEVPGAEARVVVGLLPYLSEARVAREGTGEPGSLADDAARYGERLGRELAARAAHADPGAVNVLALHQFVVGSTPSESERRLRLTAYGDLDAAAIPAGLHYVACGHLHRPQPVIGAPSPAAYAGSPIAYSFSEAEQRKRAVLVEASPGRAATLTDVPLSAGRPLEVWAVRSLDEARERATGAGGRAPIVELRVDLGRPLTAADSDALFALPGPLVHSVRDLHAPATRGGGAAGAGEDEEARVEQLFRELWVRRYEAEPDEETMAELGSALMEVARAEDR